MSEINKAEGGQLRPAVQPKEEPAAVKASQMYSIFQGVIDTGAYILSEMLLKIRTAWVWGDITEEEMNRLNEQAREKADPNAGADIMQKLEDHEKRLRKLEEGTAPEPSEEYPPYEVHKVYYTGDKVNFEGKRYICNLPEHTPSTTWSPRDYPPYWKEVK